MATYGIPTKAIHEQWLGLVQPVGLVVAPAVLTKLELVPNQSTKRLSAMQLQLEGLLEKVDGLNGDPVKVVPSFQQLATDLLDWSDSDLVEAKALETVPEVVLSEYGETLRPTHGVPKEGAEGLQALVLDLTQWRDTSGTLAPQWGRDLDAPWNPTGNGWDATPQQRFERLLKESEHPIGLLFNGTQLRLVHAPRGESSGHITLPLEPMAEVAGRPMLGALELLLGVDRLFGGNPEQRLPVLLAASRENQNEVSTRLAEQVLEALWVLLIGFDEAERLAREAGRTILGDLSKSEEGRRHLYGGLITVLLRMVFLLYAEDEALMPADSLYGQHYSISALADRLRQERFVHHSAMRDRRGAYASLLSLFRLVYDGGGADPNYLPARHGELFDPDAYPFLEGRNTDSKFGDGVLANLPAVSDDVVEKVLTRLLWLADENKVAQRLSYRSLDVEQIGSVYEGIMGFTVEQAEGASLCIAHRFPNHRTSITLVINCEELLAQPSHKRETWIEESLGAKLGLTDTASTAIREAASIPELTIALERKLSRHFPATLAKGSLVLQPSADRRRSGSHYTPRRLTRPIVEESLRPWIESHEGRPSSKDILNLKICDPAMGSGAFLVETCRYLGELLEKAWQHEGMPEELKLGGYADSEDPLIYARRVIAQRCIYGVDKNIFAVNLARLSLWLVTLSRKAPFTFVDHALKHGDSLVGPERKEIDALLERSKVIQADLFEQAQGKATKAEFRHASFSRDSRIDNDDSIKREAYAKLEEANNQYRIAGTLIAAAYFNEKNAKKRTKLLDAYCLALGDSVRDSGAKNEIMQIVYAYEHGYSTRVFPWEVEFPEVFERENPGFDVFVGNPPFLGTRLITLLGGGPNYLEWLKSNLLSSKGHIDLCAFFFLRSLCLLREGGSFGFIATSNISTGDNRSIAMSRLVEKGASIYSAQKNIPWPGEASVVISIIHARKNAGDRFKFRSMQRYLNGIAVDSINTFLEAADEPVKPSRLVENLGLAFEGTHLGGNGFVLSDDEYNSLMLDPRNRKVIKPLIGGDEVNGNLEFYKCRNVISFGSLSLDEAKLFPDVLDIVKDRVKPKRDAAADNGPGNHGRKYWWQHTLRADPMYAAIANLESCLAKTKVSRYHIISFARTGGIFNNSVHVFPFDDHASFAVLQSNIHRAWAEKFCSKRGTTTTYSVKDGFDTFPFPPAWKNNKNLAVIGEEYCALRGRVSRELGLSFTQLYSSLNDSRFDSEWAEEMRRLTKELDHVVINAYGLNESLDLGEYDFIDPDLNEVANDSDGSSRASKTGSSYCFSKAMANKVILRLLAINKERSERQSIDSVSFKSKGYSKPVERPRGRGSLQERLF